MAAIEQLIISKVIEDQEISEVLQLGVKPEHFGGMYVDAWRWIVDYNTKHGQVPTDRAFSLAHAEITIEDTSGETFTGLVDELVDHFRQDAVARATSEAVAALNADNTQEAVQRLAEGLAEASAETLVLKDTDLVETWEERYETYKARSEDPRSFWGIRTGFPTLDDLTGGFRKQQFILFVGEPKRGKSLFSLIAAQAANEISLCTVMYVSFEMSAEEVGSRYDALYAHVPFNDLLNGNLTKKQLERVRRAGELRKEKDPFIVSEDRSRMATVAAIQAKASDLKPDLIVIDGMYMLKASNGETDERKILTSVTRDTKRMAQALDIPVIGTTQVLASKVTTRGRKIEAHAIGYTGSFVQDADIVIGCERDPDSRDQSLLRIVEARSVAQGHEIKVQWNWDTMEFNEVSPPPDEDDDDDDGMWESS